MLLPLLLSLALQGLPAALAADQATLLSDSAWPMSLQWQGDYLLLHADTRRAELYAASSLALIHTKRLHTWSAETSLSQDGSAWLTVGRRANIWDTTTGDRRAGYRDSRSNHAIGLDPQGARVAFSTDMGLEWVRVQDDQHMGVAPMYPQSGGMAWLDKDLVSLGYGQVQISALDGTLVESFPVNNMSAGLFVGGESAFLPTWQGTVQTLNLRTGELSWLPVHQIGQAFCASPDGTKLAWVSASTYRVVVFDVARGRVSHDLPTDPSGASLLAFSPDSQRLASVGIEGVLRVHDLTQHRDLAFQDTVIDLAFNGEDMLVARATGEVESWNMGQLQAHASLPIAVGYSDQLAFLGQDQALVATSKGSTERIQLFTGKVLGGPYPGTQNDTVVYGGPDGSYATLSGGWLHAFQPDGTPAGRSPAASSQIFVGPQGAELLLINDLGEMVVYDLLHGRSRATAVQGDGVYTAQLVRAGDYDSQPQDGSLEVILVNGNGDLVRWDLNTEPETLAEASEFWIAAADIQAGQALLADSEGHLRLHDLSGALLQSAQVKLSPGTYIERVAVHPSKPLAMVGQSDGMVWGVDLLSGESRALSATLRGHTTVFSEGGRVLRTTAGVATLTDGATQALDYEGSLTAGVLLPDGGVLAGDSRGKLLRWDGAVWTEGAQGPESAVVDITLQGSTMLVRYADSSVELRMHDLSLVQSGLASQAVATEQGWVAWDYEGLRRGQLSGESELLSLSKSQSRGITGPMARCPDDSVVLAMDGSWRGGQSLALLQGDKVTDLDIVLPPGITTLACSEQGIFAGHASGDVYRLSPDGITLLGLLPGDGSAVSSLSMDGDTLYVGSLSGLISVWDAQGGHLSDQRILASQVYDGPMENKQ